MERTVKEHSTVKIPNNESTTRPLALPPLNLAPITVGDNGKVRMGMFTPLFPATPAT